MNKNWIEIGVLSGMGLIGGLAALAVSIYSKISYDVISYTVQSINSKGITIRIFFGVTNGSKVDLDIWNQNYDVYVSGNKVAQITSYDRYVMFKGITSIIPLNVTLLWKELESNIVPISGQLQVNTIASLPVFIKGHLSVKSGIIGLKKFPVRWRTRVGEFLP